MDRLLYIGCTPGNDVAMLQADLNTIRNHVGQGSAYETLVTDGIFGAKTHNRVAEFQRINHLSADGIAGPQTKGKLQELFSSQPGLQAQQAGGGVVPDTPQGSVGKPVPAMKGGQQGYGKMPPCDGSSGHAAKGGADTFGAQGKGVGSSPPQYPGMGKIPFGRTGSGKLA